MKALVYTQYGSPQVLKITEIAQPVPRENDVLIKIQAASVNSWDWDLVRGKPYPFRLFFGLFRPKLSIIGADIAGRVEAVGGNVRSFQPGDEVFGDISGCGWGGFAEYVCAHENALARKSPGMTFEEAASFPQAAVLALQGLRDNGQLRKGQRVLIIGAGGGVGTFAVQIARSLGAEVTGVDRAEKLDLIRSRGADQVVDYTREDCTKPDLRYDLILDVAAYRSVLDYQPILSPQGRYVMVGGSIARILQVLFLGPWLDWLTGKKAVILAHKPNPKDLIFMNELFAAGKVAATIDRRYRLSEVPEALSYLGAGNAQGKLVIILAPNEESARASRTP